MKTYIAPTADGTGFAEYYLKTDADKYITELKARIHELESMPHTDNSAVIDLLSNELQKLRPMEAALEIAESDNKKYIERIKELEAENEKLGKCKEWMKLHFYCEEMLAVEKQEHKATKHALWMSRARTAHLEKNCFISDMYDENATAEESAYAETMSYKWHNVKQLCIKKSKEYECETAKHAPSEKQSTATSSIQRQRNTPHLKSESSVKS